MRATRLQSMSALIQAREQGKRVVLIESYAIDMEVCCDQTILIRSGTDGALALAMMHVMEEGNLVNRDLLAHRTNRYETSKKTLAPYTPAWAEGETGISTEVIAGLLREYALVPAPAIILRGGPSRCDSGRMTTRLVTVLSVYTGTWGHLDGGLCGCNPGADPYVDDRLVAKPDFREKPGHRVNINEIASTFTGSRGEKPIRSFHVYGGNPVASVCRQKGTLEDLLCPNLSTMVHERFMIDTATCADALLPTTFPMEQTDVYTTYGYCTFGTVRKVAEPAGQSKSNWSTLHLLARATGYGEEYFKRTEGEVVWELLAHPMEGLTRISKRE